MTAGNVLSCMICRQAASYFADPSSASYSHCWMFSPAGHALLHGGRLCTYAGRSVRQAPVWLARLDPTSKVIANDLRMSFSSGS
jgi:hypothetical protein